jgi:phosphatidylglycerol---prolipoprotein diacylglyceryl transferase
MFVFPNPPPAIALSIGPLDIRWYGLMYITGLVIAWRGLKWSSTQRYGLNVTLEQIDDLIFYCAVGLIVGGRLGYMLFYNFDILARDSLALFKVWQGGMSFHGGLLGGIFGLYVYSRSQSLSFISMLDFVAPWVPPGLLFGRLGNFINGELWGSVASEGIWWAVIVNGIPRHPSQIYEAFLEGLLLFIILQSLRRSPRPKYFMSGCFLLGYSISRILIEFIRLPDLHLNPETGGYLAFGWLTMGQVLTIPMVFAGIIMIYHSLKLRS